MSGTEILLPFPPSVNQIWRAVKGRNILSKEARAWKGLAGHAIRNQLSGSYEAETIHPGPVNISITFGLPDKRRRDPDNYLKLCMDALVTAGIITDDSFKFINNLTIGSTFDFKGARILITEAEGT